MDSRRGEMAKINPEDIEGAFHQSKTQDIKRDLHPQGIGRWELTEKGTVQLIFTWEDYLEEKGIGERYWGLDPSRVHPEIIKYGDNLRENIEAGRGLVIRGDVGVGKTMSLIYILQRNFELLKERKKYLAEYFFSPNLFSALHKQDEEIISKARKARLILLDDFGREYRESFALAQFEGLIEYWHSSTKTMIITTNILFEDIEDYSLLRIIDRWREDCALVTIGGKSKRGGK